MCNKHYFIIFEKTKDSCTLFSTSPLYICFSLVNDVRSTRKINMVLRSSSNKNKNNKKLTILLAHILFANIIITFVSLYNIIIVMCRAYIIITCYATVWNSLGHNMLSVFPRYQNAVLFCTQSKMTQRWTTLACSIRAELTYLADRFASLQVRWAFLSMFRQYHWRRAVMLTRYGDARICDLGAKAIYDGKCCCLTVVNWSLDYYWSLD